MTILSHTDIARYYRWMLDREPEPEIVEHYRTVGLSKSRLVAMIAASDEFAQRLQRMDAPVPNGRVAQAVDVRDAAFWRRYVPFWNPDSPVPYREAAFQTYRVRVRTGDLTVKSMLSSLELALLFALAKDYWSGDGDIVDLGCLYGLTTRCLAEGVARNTHVTEAAKKQRIYAYDLFLAENYDWWSQGSSTVHAGSWFSEFLAVNHDHIDTIVPCPGDLLHMSWGRNPIEILMIDASKSWELNAWIVSNLFPRLIPGKSIVVQQDLIHYVEYWILITMEYFSERFELVDAIYGSSAYYLCQAPISEEEARFDLNALPFEEKERLLLAAIARHRPSARAALQGSYAKLLVDSGAVERARGVLAGMDTCPLSDDVAYDFSQIAKADRESLDALLTQSA